MDTDQHEFISLQANLRVYSCVFVVNSVMKSIEEKRREFRRLHESGCFAIPNPWDIGTAKYLQTLGFKAIATTSAGFAF